MMTVSHPRRRRECETQDNTACGVDILNRRIFLSAVRLTFPVLLGYLAIGIAFGLMLSVIGFGVIWSFFMSVTIYAGSGQYMGVQLLSTGAALTEVAVMTFILNFRHMVYGLSMLEKFRDMGKKKLYMIFSLTDETYALLSSATLPEGIDSKKYYFAVAVLNQIYWISGSVIGSLAGTLIKFNTEGIDFAMTALFIVIAVDQWKAYKKHLPAIIGAACTLVALVIFGSGKMLIPALAAIIVLLIAIKPRMEDKEDVKEEVEY